MDQALKRVEEQEKLVKSLRKELDELQKTANEIPPDILVCENIGESIANLEKENAKLKYRLGIMERAKGPQGQSNDSTEISHMRQDRMPSLVGCLVDLFRQAVGFAFPDLPLDSTSILITATAKPEFGDYQFNSAMGMSKLVKLKPRQVAEKILAALPKWELVAKTEIAGPGYINITISTKFICSEVNKIVSLGVRPPLGPVTESKKRVLVDFSSPNVAKEMHVGHLRSTIIGDCVCRLLEFLGHDVMRINHLGDWGTQFGMLIAHLKDTHPEYLSNPPTVGDLQAFYKASKARFDSDAEFKQRAYAAVVSLQNGESSHVTAWKLIVAASEREFSDIYRRLDVKIESRGESFYQSRMKNAVKDLKAAGLLLEEDGRHVMFAPGFSVPLTIIKSDGGYTYDTSDLTAVRQRVDEEKLDWIVYETDSGQADHFNIVWGCAEKAGWLDRSKVRLDHVGHGSVLGEDKKKLKTRSGESIRLVDLLDEGLKRSEAKLVEKGRKEALSEDEWVLARDRVAYSCIKYNDLCHDRVSDYVFSFDKMLEDKGNTAAYLLYMLTRIRSIGRSAGTSSELLVKAAGENELLLSHPKELKLAKTLLRFSDAVLLVAEDLKPHVLCNYIYELASVFSEFYEACYCVEKDPKSGQIITVHTNRLILCEATANVMSKTFDILGLMPVSKISDKIMSRGQEETSALQANIEQQVARLVLQLAELEEAKDELDAEEYAECREDTIQQLEDFNKTLSGMKEGSVSLVNEINAAQLAIRAAISQAFGTPEVMSMFAQKDVAQLRLRLQQGKGNRREILTALKLLSEPLSEEEKSFLEQKPDDNAQLMPGLVALGESKMSETKVKSLQQAK